MKKIKQFLRKLKNNAGSSIVMVVVSIAFIGIIVGALLAAAVQSYRLKLQELNAKDNFYYVEQAMNEVYAGVGSQTVEDLQTAYVYTVENMVYYDLSKGRYVTKTQDEAQKMFAAKFYNQLQTNPFFKEATNTNISSLAAKLESYISNDTVKLDSSRLQVEDYKKGDELVGKIIRNVKLSRTQEYNKNTGSGTYVQSITTDIVIGDPDFAVLFDAINDQDPNIFKYALVADMGVVVDQKDTPLTIAGNVYAASDYYNKQYNESTWNDKADATRKKYTNSKNSYTITKADGTTEELSDVYTHGNVTSKSAIGESTDAKYTYYDNDGKNTIATKDLYNGENIKSKYSGFYVNGSQVSIVADTVIVPGTMAVMDDGSLSVYGKSGSQTAQAEVWTDNIVIDGYSRINETTNQTTGEVTTTYDGADAIMKANLYVKDDTELNAAGSSFQLTGSYFGYGDSTEKDNRKFTGVVNTTNFQVEVYNEDGTVKTGADGKPVMENRGHYNSSAIIVNGEQSTLNLSQAQSLFLAGRTYIELSKDVNTVNGTIKETSADPKDPNKTVETTVKTVTDTYTYHPKDYSAELPDTAKNAQTLTTTIRDYKMGESVSVKSNQQAYIPVTYNGIPTLAKDTAGNSLGYYLAELPPALQGVSIFETYFPKEVYKDGKIPCVLQLISKKDAATGTYTAEGKKYYYYDFNQAYEDVKAYNEKNLTDAQMTQWLTKYPSAQYFASGFIADYTAELQKHKAYVNATNKTGLTDSVIAKYLVDITDFEDFQTGDIILPDTENNPNASIYSSGAITTKKGTTFSIVRADDTDVATSLLASAGLAGMNAGNEWTGSVSNTDEKKIYTDAYQLSNDLEMEYNIMKWNLGHLDTSETLDDVTKTNNKSEKSYITDLVNDATFGGDSMITPINKFVDVSKITPTTKISPDITGSDSGDGIMNLASGYSVWISNDDVTVKARSTDKGKVRGIVVTKGNVYFSTDAANGNAVTDFEGMIIAGGKVYVNGNVKTIVANAEICRTILRECLLNSDNNSKFVSDLFRGYEPSSSGSGSGGTTGAEDEPKSIDMIDYTDVVSFSNWMKNVE